MNNNIFIFINNLLINIVLNNIYFKNYNLYKLE